MAKKVHELDFFEMCRSVAYIRRGGESVGLAEVWLEETAVPSIGETTGEFCWCWSITLDGKIIRCGTTNNREDGIMAAKEAYRLVGSAAVVGLPSLIA